MLLVALLVLPCGAAADVGWTPIAGGATSSPVLLVAATDATAAEKAAAQYQCDGTDDHGQILAAVGDLPSQGGIVRLSSGNFSGDAVVIERSNVTAEGAGTGATTYQMAAQTRSVSGDSRAFGFHGTSGTPLTNVHIRDFTVDGNASATTDDSGGNWQLEGIDFKYVHGGSVVGMVVHDAFQDGIDLDGSEDIEVVLNRLVDNGGYGVHLGGDGGDGTNRRHRVIGNYAEGNGFGASSPARGGFDQNENSEDAVFIGNVAIDNYRNYNIIGSGATFIGNKSLGTTTASDVFTGVSDSGGSVDLSTYPSASGQAAGKVAETDGSDGWTFIDTPTGGESGRWELVVEPDESEPPVAVWNEDGSDFVYALVED